MTSKLTITPQAIITAVSAIVTQAVAFGLLDSGTAQTVVAAAGVIIPSVFLLATSLHLGQVHAAMIKSASTPTPPVVAAVPIVKKVA